ncbi:MerR family transcriptional regulator [Cryobacterium adonitolivorans]|uniref:MerR family transcriptional regulator n=1 Tax=Cryobacterium adonitolivorans TaxID=1259189 RepID=A0A4R8W620_9MICO|nr:MerR family transcriptional regulator [Cryobacterium adonitolivorans]TFC01519.1 MerR family transcriptional regulator [Cryobacterium adonitolivorans]
MTDLRISEVASRTGLASSAIRYYESVGLLSPAKRAANGYRMYTESDVERLLFVAGAKRLDLSLAEVKDLVVARESDVCAHVQSEMQPLVAARLAETRAQIEDLTRLSHELEDAAARLSEAPPAGPCTDACACVVLTGGIGDAPVGARLFGLSAR